MAQILLVVGVAAVALSLCAFDAWIERRRKRRSRLLQRRLSWYMHGPREDISEALASRARRHVW